MGFKSCYFRFYFLKFLFFIFLQLIKHYILHTHKFALQGSLYIKKRYETWTFQKNVQISYRNSFDILCIIVLKLTNIEYDTLKVIISHSHIL